MSQLHPAFLRHDRLALVRSHGSYRGAKKAHKVARTFPNFSMSILANMPLAEASHMTKTKLNGGRTQPLWEEELQRAGRAEDAP